MANDRPEVVKMNAPMGTFKWPKIVEPDYGTKDYPKPEGEYSVKVVFDETDPAFVKFRDKMQPFIDAVEEKALAEFAALKKPQRDKLGEPRFNDMFTPIYDEDDEPTGQVEVKFSSKAGGVVKKGPRAGKKWSRKPQLFDALGRPIKGKIEVWGGTEGIIAFSFTKDGYFIPATGAWGIKLQLEAAQIVTLRSGGERSADDYGFGKQEGGFDATQLPAEGESEGDEDGDDLGGDHLPSGDDEGGDPAGAAGF